MDSIHTGEKIGGNSTKAADFDYNGAQINTKLRPQTRGTAQLAAGVHLLPTGGIFKSAAVEVLRREQRLMATGEICKLALEWGLLKCSGKTPEATMASSLYGDIKRNDGGTLFFRPSGGMFGLKEWIEQGIFPPPPESGASAIDGTKDSYQKGGKWRRKNNNASSSKPQLAVKRQQRLPPPPLQTVVGAAENHASTEGKKVENHTNQNIFEGNSSWQHITTTSNTLVKSKTAAMANTPAAEHQRLRRRLLTSESNEAAGTSTATATHKYPLPTTSTENGAVPAELSQQDWVLSALMEQEEKVAAVENKFGSLHPRAGQAHLLLYKACKQQALRFPSVESRAQTALTRAYDVMMFNTQVEELGKLQGFW